MIFVSARQYAKRTTRVIYVAASSKSRAVKTAERNCSDRKALMLAGCRLGTPEDLECVPTRMASHPAATIK